MKNLTFYLIVIIIVLAGTSYTFYHLNKKHKQDAERWSENFNQVQKQVQQIDLTVSDFKKLMDSKTDSILEIAKIKPKNVKQVTTYNNYYTDTTINQITPEYEPKTGTYPFIDKKGCFEFKGFINVVDTVPKLNVTNRAFNQDFTEIEHWEKDTINFIGLKLVKWWQKKRLTYTLIDNCTGEKHVKKINVR